jgi:hypothetical protein
MTSLQQIPQTLGVTTTKNAEKKKPDGFDWVD